MKFKKNYILFLFILIFAVIIRIIFFIGYANCQSQDDGIYINSIDNAYRRTLVFRKDLINETLIDPSLIPTVRTMFVYPSALFVWLFGLKETSFIIYPFICSIGLISLLYFIGKNVFNERVGLIAAFLLSFFPLDVIYSTRIMPDLPYIFFMTFSIYFFLISEKGKKGIYYFLSGLSLGVSYLIKEAVIVILPIISIYILYKKNIRKKYLLLIFGFLIIIIAEMFFFYFNTGNALYRFHIISGAHLQKETIELGSKMKKINFDNIIQFLYPDGFDFLGHTKNFFILPNATSKFLEYFGFFYYFVLLGIIYLIFKKDKKSYFFLIWFVIVYLYIEFGAFSISLNFKEIPYIKYMMILKESDMSRLAMLLTVPSTILIALFLSKIKFELSLIIILFLLLTSLYYINLTRQLFVDGIKDTREAYNFIKKFPIKTIYGDYLTVNQINFFSGFNPFLSFKNLGDEKEISDAYVIIGGSRGCEVSGDYVISINPKFTSNYPENWKILTIISGKRAAYRNANMTIFYVSKK
jgi:4-amino-4-deoxy-L-arabinose transferase-like glycosyltransferase